MSGTCCFKFYFFYSQNYVRTGQLLPDMKSLLQILTQERRKLNEDEILELLIQKNNLRAEKAATVRRTLKQEIYFNEELRDVMKEILSISVDEDENTDKEKTNTDLVNKVMAGKRKYKR